MDSLIAFFTPYQLPILTFHILGMAIGLGGATISDILFFKFLKDHRISKKEASVLHIMRFVILSSVIVIIATGVGLYLTDIARFNASPQFWVKVIAVAVLTVNGFALHEYIAPHLIKLNFQTHKDMHRKLHHAAFALGSISIISWYTAFFIAMLKSRMPDDFGLLLSAYVLLLAIGIIVSQMLEGIFRKRAH